MPKVVKLRKGLDIKLEGEAIRSFSHAKEADFYGVVPDDYMGIVPRLLVKEGDDVESGTPVFFDKERPEVLFASPVSGKVKEIVRGEKRKITAIIIENDYKRQSKKLEVPSNPTALEVKEFLQKSALWGMLIQRPFGLIADPQSPPRGIYSSSFDSSPLAPDMDFVLNEHKEDLEIAIKFLSIIAPVHIGVSPESQFTSLKGADTTIFQGKHPAGNVGVQIANTCPINKGDVVWTIDIQHMAMLGSMLRSGEFNLTKTTAVAGSEVSQPKYVKCISGAPIQSLVEGNTKNSNIRYLSGNPLTGRNVGRDGWLGFYDNQITLLPEGDHYEFLGWARTRLNKFSINRSYFSWLTPQKKYKLDTNLNGGERAFIMGNSLYEKVLPMDIYPVELIKAVMAFNIDKMEQLGIYEVLEEDLALCEFICPSKVEWQAVLRDGITKMIKEI